MRREVEYNPETLDYARGVIVCPVCGKENKTSLYHLPRSCECGTLFEWKIRVLYEEKTRIMYEERET